MIHSPDELPALKNGDSATWVSRFDNIVDYIWQLSTSSPDNGRGGWKLLDDGLSPTERADVMAYAFFPHHPSL